MGDAELVQDGAQLEHGDAVQVCACEHSASRESCCDHPCINGLSRMLAIRFDIEHLAGKDFHEDFNVSEQLQIEYYD